MNFAWHDTFGRRRYIVALGGILFPFLPYSWLERVKHGEEWKACGKPSSGFAGIFRVMMLAQAGAGGRGAGRATPDVTISRSSIPEH